MNAVDGWTISDLEALVHLDLESLTEKTPRDFAFYYLDIASVSEGRITVPTVETLFRDAPSRARKVVHRHDVLMSMVRPNLKGFAYFDHAGEKFIASTGFAVLTAREEADPRFILYAILSDNTSRQIEALVSGSNYPAINSSSVRRLQVLTPPKSEQTEIGDILSTVDRSIEQTEALIAKQQCIKVGLMQHLLTRGVDQRGNLRSERTHKFRDTSLGKIPEEWRIARVGDLFEKRCEHGKAGLPVMAVVMKDGLVERAKVERRVESNLPAEGHALVVKGDIAYNMMRMWQGVLGRAQFDCLVSPAYVVLKPRENINTHFAEWLFRDEQSVLKFRRASRGVVDDRLRLYAHDLFAIEVAVPNSVDEQEAIAERLDAIKDRIAKENAVLEKYQQLRVGLMQDLLTGRKRVTALLESKSKREKVYAGD